MPREITTTVYTYAELPTEVAKQRARNWWDKGNHDWYESVYEDAAQAGIKIKQFDLYCKKISLELINGDTTTAEYIFENHGKDCETYKAAQKWDAAIDALPDLPEEGSERYNEMERELCEGRDVIDAQFTEDLGKAYLKMLADELEHSQSEEAIAEALNANEYTFTADGRRFD